MNRALLDVNVLIALLDGAHTCHGRAHAWWAANRDAGWASCPLTENGMIRIMSQPAYSRTRHFSPLNLIAALHTFTTDTLHEFWPDDISLRDGTRFAAERIHSSRLITDLYLLALATAKNGRLVTFDQGIPLSAIIHATPLNLCVI